MLAKSFIWWTMVWFHRLFRSRILFKFNILNTILRLNWMPTFLRQPWNDTRSTPCAIWKNNLETFEKLFSMIQPRCSIYSRFLKPLHWNIHGLWHQALIVIKIIVEDVEIIVKSLHFLHLTSVNSLVYKIRLCFDITVKTHEVLTYVKVMCKWAFT